jgi:hypothetical protein
LFAQSARCSFLNRTPGLSSFFRNEDHAGLH